MSDSTLIAHAGAKVITRDELCSIETPHPTATWSPIPHHVLVERFEQVLRNRGMRITNEKIAVSAKDGAKLFGVFDVELANVPDFTAAVGLRSSNDKSLGLKMIAGARVFVCDNLAFNGGNVVLNRKHTGRLDLIGELSVMVQRLKSQYGEFFNRINTYKNTELDETRAKCLLHDAMVRNVVPIRLLPKISAEYFEPRHKEFEARNYWSAYNAFTEVAKEVPLGDTNIATLQSVSDFFLTEVYKN